MSRIRGRDTAPERGVRSALHRAGFRFRTNVRDLPGSPDVVLPRYRVAVFVHGCYWHRHDNCHLTTTPSTNRDFWLRKFSDNQARDRRNVAALEAAGWQVHVVWECDVRGTGPSLRRLIRALERRRRIIVSQGLP